MVAWPGVTPDYIMNNWSYPLFDLMTRSLVEREQQDRRRHAAMMKRMKDGLPVEDVEETDADRDAFYRAVGAE